MPLAVFKARKLHFPSQKRRPGKPLIFHDFAPECEKATTGWRPCSSLPEN